MPFSEHVYCVVITLKMTEQVEQWICIRLCIKFEHSPPQKIFRWFRRPLQWATGDWQLHHDNAPAHASRLVQSFLAEHQITQVTQPPYNPASVRWDFWLFPKLKTPLKVKRFQTIDVIQENTMGQLMAFGRTVWGSKVLPSKGTEASLSYVRCFLYLHQ